MLEFTQARGRVNISRQVISERCSIHAPLEIEVAPRVTSSPCEQRQIGSLLGLCRACNGWACARYCVAWEGNTGIERSERGRVAPCANGVALRSAI